MSVQSRREILEDTIRRATEWLDAQDDEVAGSSLAAVLQRRVIASLELEQLPGTGEKSKRDELRERRRQREADRKSS